MISARSFWCVQNLSFAGKEHFQAPIVSYTILLCTSEMQLWHSICGDASGESTLFKIFRGKNKVAYARRNLVASGELKWHFNSCSNWNPINFFRI